MSRSSRPAALVVMAKQPTAGSTKTRLSPLISQEAAADLYEAFLLDALDIARSVGGVEALVAIYPPTAGEYFERIAPDLAQIEQVGGSLAERLCGVLANCSLRYDKVVAINSDSPTLPAAFIAEAFDRLDIDAVDVVIGPCEDGGYYLIGWKTPQPSLIRDVTMSTPHVLRDTLRAADQLGVSVTMLDGWYDVDENADLERLQRDLAATSRGAVHTRKFLAALGAVKTP